MRNRQCIWMGLSMAALAAASGLAVLSLLDAARVRPSGRIEATHCRAAGLDWCPASGLASLPPPGAAAKASADPA